MVVPPSDTPIQIESYKHNTTLHRMWHDSLVLYAREDMCIVANDKTLVTECDGQTWTTREPAICYFYTDYWFNVIGMIKEDGVYYYCNIASPFVYDADMRVIKYIDYDLDVKVYPDMTYELLDEDEYESHKHQMGYPEKLNGILYRNIDYLLNWVRQRKDPFSPEHLNQWYKRFLTYR